MEITAGTAAQLRITEEEFEVIKTSWGVHPTLQSYVLSAACGANIAVIKIPSNFLKPCPVKGKICL